MRHENEVNQTKLSSYCQAFIYVVHNQKTMKKLFSIVSNLQIDYHFKLDFQKVDQHTAGKWLIHGTKHHKDN